MSADKEKQSSKTNDKELDDLLDSKFNLFFCYLHPTWDYTFCRNLCNERISVTRFCLNKISIAFKVY